MNWWGDFKLFAFLLIFIQEQSNDFVTMLWKGIQAKKYLALQKIFPTSNILGQSLWRSGGGGAEPGLWRQDTYLIILFSYILAPPLGKFISLDDHHPIKMHLRTIYHSWNTRVRSGILGVMRQSEQLCERIQGRRDVESQVGPLRPFLCRWFLQPKRISIWTLTLRYTSLAPTPQWQGHHTAQSISAHSSCFQISFCDFIDFRCGPGSDN